MNVKTYNEFDVYDKCCAECDGMDVEYVIEVGHVEIPLCKHCFNELRTEMEEALNIKFCKDCKHFIMSEYGIRYCGGCEALQISVGNLGAHEHTMGHCGDFCLKDIKNDENDG